MAVVGKISTSRPGDVVEGLTVTPARANVLCVPNEVRQRTTRRAAIYDFGASRQHARAGLMLITNGIGGGQPRRGDEEHEACCSWLVVVA